MAGPHVSTANTAERSDHDCLGGEKAVLMRTLSLALAWGLLACGAALAQSNPFGDPNVSGDPSQNFDHWREGWPVTLQIETQDVESTFSGAAINVPFSLNGSRANVYLAVYTKGAHPQYSGPGGLGRGGPGNALLRASGLDTFVVVTGPRLFEEGSNTFSWDARDYHGNPIRSGTYEYFLIGVNDVDNPTYISGSGTVWWQFGIDDQTDPPAIWFGHGETSSPVSRARFGDNLMTNPGAWENYDVSWMRERTGKDKVADPIWRDISGWKIDPQDNTIHYAANDRDEQNVTNLGVGFTTGLWRLRWDQANGTMLPDENWGGDADLGRIVHEGRLPSLALTADAHHPWIPDDGFIYAAWFDRDYEPYTPGVLKVDRSTGTIVDIIDMTDIFVYDDPNFVRPSGPFGLDVDDRGFYANGFSGDFGFQSATDLEGNILWINSNGDDFEDRYSGDEATTRGYTQLPTAMTAPHMTVGKFHMAILSGYTKPWGAVLYGPDGAGLVKLEGQKRVVALSGHTWWHATDDRIAGLFYNSGQAHQLHAPFDIENGMITGVRTAVEEVAAAALPTAYELQTARPNPFNPETMIEFAVPATGGAVRVNLTVYNLAGQEIAVLADEEVSAGFYKTTWDGRNAQGQAMASGIYIYTLRAGGEVIGSKRMTLVK